MIEYHHRLRRFKFKKPLSLETKNAVRWLLITLSGIIAILTITFIAITNQNAQKGYNLNQIKLRNEQLKTENSRLTTKLTNASAFSKIEENQQIKKMKEAETRQYVTREDNTVQ